MNLQSISNIFYDNNSNDESLLNNEKLIRIGDILQGIEKNNTEVPTLVVVGTQSSGKTSVLNSLIGIDVLPTGKEMVTRTPLKIEIVRNIQNTNNFVEVGEYNNGIWNKQFRAPITYPNPTPAEKEEISDIIERETIRKAGHQKDVSDNMIFLKICCANTTNLSFIDLPGLTAVACTDRGQPANIKEKIENLVKKYAEPESTVIMAILPGRNDLEADYGLEMVKKLDPTGVRTIGILTKLDLMNDERDIIKYLNNDISRDLQLTHGYFAVRNRNNIERDTMSIQDALVRERSYFEKNSNFQLYKDKLGHYSLKKYLVELLAKIISEDIPVIRDNVINELKQLEKNQNDIGFEIPDGELEKKNYIQHLLLDLSNLFQEHPELGRNIRDIFIEFRTKVKNYNIFLDDSIKDSDIIEIIKNSEGNHMSLPYPPVEIIERCLQCRNNRPIFKIFKEVEACNQKIVKELSKSVGDIINLSHVKHFQKLKNLIKHSTINILINDYSESSHQHLKELILMQENYIWTDNTIFLEKLKTFSNPENNLVESLRELLGNYISCIVENIVDYIPKAIMFHLVDKVSNEFYHQLIKDYQQHSVDDLLSEDPNLVQKRLDIKNRMNELKLILEEIDKISLDAF